MKVSVILSARNEYPSIVHCVHNILEDLGSFLELGDYEVIIVDNLSDDEKDRRALGGTSDFLRCRGAYANGMVRVLHYPYASNVGARNFGAEHALGEYIFFSDAHMFYGRDTFKQWIQTIDECGGIVHPAVAWMGSYPPQKGMQYSIKLGEEIKGTWANYQVGDGKNWFYVAGMGHCSLGMKRQQFLDFGGYIENKCYGGGELYLDALWWMRGSCSVTEPRINAYHLSSERGYSYDHDDYIHNVFKCGYALGADWWLERVFINYLRKGRREVLDALMSDAKKGGEAQRLFNAKHCVMSFNDWIKDRPWDKKNIERLGSSNSGILVYQDTWIKVMEESPVAKKFYYEEAKHQNELAKFIDENLSQYVYGRKNS